MLSLSHPGGGRGGRGGGRVGMLWWIWRTAFQTFRQLLWRVSFGSWMFCAQRFRGLFCGDVGFLSGLRREKKNGLAYVALRSFSFGGIVGMG